MSMTALLAKADAEITKLRGELADRDRQIAAIWEKLDYFEHMAGEDAEIKAEMLAALKFARTIIGHPDDSGSKLIADVIARAEKATP